MKGSRKREKERGDMRRRIWYKDLHVKRDAIYSQM